MRRSRRAARKRSLRRTMASCKCAVSSTSTATTGKSCTWIPPMCSRRLRDCDQGFRQPPKTDTLMMKPTWTFNPKLDLMLERVVDVPADLVWDCWTIPEHIKVWFTPRPWRTTECEIDLRPGGKFRTVMQGPEGQVFDLAGCYLEIVPKQRLVW